MHLEAKTNILRDVYIDNDYYRVDLEDCDGYLFVHVNVYKWSPQILKMMRCDWEELKYDAYMNGYDYIFTYTQNMKYSRLIDSSIEEAGLMEHPTHGQFNVAYWKLEDYYGN